MRNFLTLGVVLLGTAFGQVSTGPNISYIVKRDAATGANRSVIVVREANDTLGKTTIKLTCEGKGKFSIVLNTKNKLFDDSVIRDFVPVYVDYRVDSGPLQSFGHVDTYFSTTDIYLDNEARTDMHQALIVGRKVAIKIRREEFDSDLNYVFPAMGYTAAFKAVRKCK